MFPSRAMIETSFQISPEKKVTCDHCGSLLHPLCIENHMKSHYMNFLRKKYFYYYDMSLEEVMERFPDKNNPLVVEVEESHKNHSYINTHSDSEEANICTLPPEILRIICKYLDPMQIIKLDFALGSQTYGEGRIRRFVTDTGIKLDIRKKYEKEIEVLQNLSDCLIKDLDMFVCVTFYCLHEFNVREPILFFNPVGTIKTRDEELEHYYTLKVKFAVTHKKIFLLKIRLNTIHKWIENKLHQL